MHPFSRAACLAAGRGRRSCLALPGSASGSGLRSPYASSPMHQAVSCSTLFYLWTGSSSLVASHPVSRRRSYLRLRTASVLSDGDFHPIVGAHSQAHVGSHLRGDRRPAYGQLGALTRALTLPARRLALVSITRANRKPKFLAQVTKPQVL